MKCRACGYESNDSSLEGQFIEIKSDQKFKVKNPKNCEHGDYDYKENVEAELYACPKCFTVTMAIVG